MSVLPRHYAPRLRPARYPDTEGSEDFPDGTPVHAVHLVYVEEIYWDAGTFGAAISAAIYADAAGVHLVFFDEESGYAAQWSAAGPEHGWRGAPALALARTLESAIRLLAAATTPVTPEWLSMIGFRSVL